jgi:hypothetical protein
VQIVTDKKKSKVTVDIKKNRLYITAPSTATKVEMEKIYTEVRFCVADLKPGFDVVTDLSQCTIGHLNGIPTLKKIMKYLVMNNMGRVVRIVGDISISFKQILAMASKIQCYKPVYVNTYEEAEEELSYTIKPKGLRFEINKRPIKYSINQQEGTGYLVDVSVSGCAVQESTVALIENAEVSITIPLYQEQDDLTSFTLPAKVVWVRGDRFAVQFLDIDDDLKEQLHKSLVNELQRDIH